MVSQFYDDDKLDMIVKFQNEEPLFLCVEGFLDDVDSHYQKYTSKAENWEDGKDFVMKCFKSQHPERLVNTCIESLWEKSSHHTTSFRNYSDIFPSCVMTPLDAQKRQSEVSAVLFCALAITYYLDLKSEGKYEDMVISLKNAIHFRLKFDLLFRTIKTAYDNGEIADVYDYVSGQCIPEKNVAESSIVDEGDAPVSAMQKVRLKLVFNALVKCGSYNKEKRGNPAAMARLLQCATGIDLKICQNFCTNPHVDYVTHKDDIEKIEKDLETIGISFKLGYDNGL